MLTNPRRSNFLARHRKFWSVSKIQNIVLFSLLDPTLRHWKQVVGTFLWSWKKWRFFYLIRLWMTSNILVFINDRYWILQGCLTTTFIDSRSICWQLILIIQVFTWRDSLNSNNTLMSVSVVSTYRWGQVEIWSVKKGGNYIEVFTSA